MDWLKGAHAPNPAKYVVGLGLIQLNLDYPDSLGLDEIVRTIEGPDNLKYE